jgi:hypothetical protein
MNLQMLFFLYLHTDVYNQISNLHTYTVVHTSMLIQHSTFVHMILEQLQQFDKPTWHPYNFGKTRKIGLQQVGKPTWQK